MLYEYIGLEQFMNFALVVYPTLLRHRMVPELTFQTFVRIISEIRLPATYTNTGSAVSRMPVELWLQIAEYVEPADSIGLVFALGDQFWRFPAEPSRELVTTLRVWSRRGRRR